MDKNRRVRFLIDASVARSAGETEHPVSSACRKFLEDVLRICHGLAATDALLAEWRRHASRFTQKWLASMSARRKVDLLISAENLGLRDEIAACGKTGDERQEMLKDTHLIEAALDNDLPIISRDDRARDLFMGATKQVPRLRLIVWVNPTRQGERALTWLEGGAAPESQRCLGSMQLES